MLDDIADSLEHMNIHEQNSKEMTKETMKILQKIVIKGIHNLNKK